jgi:hypothetical protein
MCSRSIHPFMFTIDDIVHFFYVYYKFKGGNIKLG